MYAVLDLGSNSFHLVIAEKTDGRVSILKTLSSKVQLAEGLSQTGKISRESRERALLAFAQFREELLKYPIHYFCIVGTSALREAKNSAAFLADARALGFPVNVITGQQEAFYIYQGVQSFLPLAEKARLIIDVGGGSTEFSIGAGQEPAAIDSLQIGCVTYRADPDEKITHKLLAKIRRRVHEVLDKQLHPEFYDLDYEEVYASSGTAKMLSAVLRENRFTNGMITYKGLLELEEKVVKTGSPQVLENLAGLKTNRRNVFVSGLAIMQSIMDHLGLDHIEYSDFALREGVLLGLVKQGEQFPMAILTDPKNGKRLI